MTSSRMPIFRSSTPRPTLNRLLSLSVAAVAAAASLATVGLVASPAQAASTAVAPTSAASVVEAQAPALYRPTDPVRLLAGVELAAGESRVVDVAGVPAGATAVWLNVTGTRAPAGATLAVCAADVGVADCLAKPTLKSKAGEAASS